MPVDLRELASRIEKEPASAYRRVGRETVALVKLIVTEEEKKHIVAALKGEQV